MDANEEILLGRRRRRLWIAVLVTLPFLAAVGGAVAWFMAKRGEARDTALVERVTGAAFGCVASIRGDAPETWGLERALEHMSRMARVTEDETSPDRGRFQRLASDAATGCQELGRVMTEAQREAPHLYFGVPAPLARIPDPEHPDRWYRRVLPESRAEVLTLTRQIRAMATAINDLRTERALMAQALPIEGRGPSELARIVTLAPVPRDREDVEGHVWPTADGVVTLRRAAIPRGPCGMRYLNRASCFDEYVQVVGWDGAVGELLTLVRPERVEFWAAFTAAPDGAIWAVGVDRRQRGVVGRYPAGATEAETAAVDTTLDGTSNIVAVSGGVAVFPSDGSAWLATDGLTFGRAENTPPPVIVRASRGAESGLEIEGYGHLAVFGDEGGWTSRLDPPEGEDVILRILDAHSRVHAVTQLRSLRSGKTVALLERGESGPSAILISPDFGRTWLSE